MNEDRARLIIEHCESWWDWDLSDKKATLDGDFTPEELEAIAFWMRLKGGQG